MPGYRKAADLPKVIPVFPLDGALLLPGGRLPLNIFEPRYLNMIDDVMSGDRIVGMIQTRGGDKERPTLAPVGCAGRITSYAESSDGRYLITLTGVCRFQPGRELPVQTPYRQVTAEFDKRLAKDANDHEARFELAKALAGQGRLDEAADHLLTIIERERDWNEDAARKQLLTVFEAAG
ncbi:MAG TPA: tetratricopeptide repeat protein, partial [Caulobacteraceae bacterium]|nr:tetratricopeptide repeat protein [Caulobacteraceae bacterium]